MPMVFLSIKFIKKNKRRYYLDDLFALLDLIKKSKIEENFKIKIPKDGFKKNKFFKKIKNILELLRST